MYSISFLTLNLKGTVSTFHAWLGNEGAYLRIKGFSRVQHVPYLLTLSRIGGSFDLGHVRIRMLGWLPKRAFHRVKFRETTIYESMDGVEFGNVFGNVESCYFRKLLILAFLYMWWHDVGDGNGSGVLTFLRKDSVLTVKGNELPFALEYFPICKVLILRKLLHLLLVGLQGLEGHLTATRQVLPLVLYTTNGFRCYFG